MRRVAAAVCFVLAMTPFAFAQDKAKDAEKKAPAATEKPVKPETPKGAQTASERAKGSTMNAEMAPKGSERAKKEPSDKQKARQVKKDCEKEAKAKKLKAGGRKQFMKECTAK